MSKSTPNLTSGKVLNVPIAKKRELHESSSNLNSVSNIGPLSAQPRSARTATSLESRQMYMYQKSGGVTESYEGNSHENVPNRTMRKKNKNLQDSQSQVAEKTTSSISSTFKKQRCTQKESSLKDIEFGSASLDSTRLFHSGAHDHGQFNHLSMHSNSAPLLKRTSGVAAKSDASCHTLSSSHPLPRQTKQPQLQQRARQSCSTVAQKGTIDDESSVDKSDDNAMTDSLASGDQNEEEEEEVVEEKSVSLRNSQNNDRDADEEDNNVPFVRNVGRQTGVSNYTAFENYCLASQIEERGVQAATAFDKTFWATLCDAVVGVTRIDRTNETLYEHYKVMLKSVRSGMSELSAHHAQLSYPYTANEEWPCDDEEQMDEADRYIGRLYLIMISDTKRFSSARWWDERVLHVMVRILLVRQQNADQQTAQNIARQSEDSRNKFQDEQRAKLDHISQKRHEEEEEARERRESRLAMTNAVTDLSSALRSGLSNSDNVPDLHDLLVRVGAIEKVCKEMDLKLKQILAHLTGSSD